VVFPPVELTKVTEYATPGVRDVILLGVGIVTKHEEPTARNPF
jgi:hypothetical protein